jgi:threonine/homoserine/homoserine lactone efflux protein
MLDHLFTSLSAFWVVLSFSFLVALTGAMAPGPLLTYTLIQSAKPGRRGYLMGVWIVAGHALLEAGLVLVLLLGFSFVVQNPFFVRAIGAAGGLFLIYFGASLIRDVRRGRISASFAAEADNAPVGSAGAGGRGMNHPVVGGIVVSMSNPYWWVWWATIGLAFMIQFQVSFSRWPRLVAFFLGHEAGDLAWYLLVSVLAFFGLRRLNPRFYHGLLVACGAIMVLFGLYLGLSPFLKSAG